MKILFVIATILLLLVPIRTAFLEKLGGTFKPHAIPSEYVKLERYLSSQKTFSRSLWVPNFQRFSSFTSMHPAIPGQDFYHVASISGVLDNLKKEGSERMLQEAGVKYVIVPFDSEGEIFLKDRKYDSATYEKTVDSVRKIAWLSEVPGFGRIHVFAVPNPKDHFYLLGTGTLAYTFVNPTKYIVTIKHVEKGDTLVFSESFDSGWKASIGKAVVSSQPFEKTFNSFVLPESGNYTLTVFYQPQKWVNKGLLVSGLTLLVVIVLLVILTVRK